MFNVISLNCNGLCDSNKWNCIFSLCNDRFYDIICLQETFWNDLFVERIKRDTTIWDGDIFYSNSGNNRQGVVTLVSKKLKKIFLDVENDNGRFVYIKGTINDKLIDIYNIYAPNNVNERYEFFLKSKQKISKGKYVLVAGDFNTTLSSLDKSGKTLHCNDKAVKSLCNFMQEKGLYDIWRNRNVNTKVFSRKQVVQGFLTQSRLDYFLLSLDLKSCIKNIHYKDTSFSDHSIVSMKVDFCNVERGPVDELLNNVNVKIDDEDVEMCDDEINIEEIEKSLKGMKKGKTPGPDGITAEFYLFFFFNELKHVLLYIYQSIEENEELSRSMRYGNINIIFKNKGDQSDLKNFRPISLLNVDYKILARVMANRFKYVLPKVISPNQSCCILGKDISDTVASVRNVMDLVEMDDIELDKNSVSETFRVLELYEKASGAKLNKEKSEVLALGKGKICSNDLKIWKIKECDEVLQLLGIWVGKNKTLCENLNWEGKVQSITKILNFWKMRHLTLHGRVSVISALLMSKLWYTLMVVNIPEKYCILIKKKCLEFLWNYKPPLVAYEVIINKVVDGGLNFPDIMQKMYGFRLKYLSRLFDENYCAIWKQTCLYFFSQFENMNLGIELLFCNLRNRKIDALPEFYQSLILSWQSICDNVDIEVNSENVFDIPLFLNPNITNGNKMLYLKTFIEAGVCKIKDIAYECKPGFLKESYIQEIVLEQFPEVSENEMIDAVRNVLETIPDEYKVLVEANVHVSKTPVLNPMIKDGVQICSLPSTTSFYYQMLVSKLSREPKSVSRWRLM
ncbi:unnamed protein product [Mytilus coruscus]|uniref:Endonuclease/exonuclease/phosphatase domain-containing protein n=1 Tax=Mytilus coruscus TaxID=42192 RepID=A0A6J8E5R1_MYTCO|nr:unnamed protein product [Mytilus coruscus]